MAALANSTEFAESLIYFDIPSQPMAAALDLYSSVSGVQILAASVDSKAPRSQSLKGLFSPQDALRQLVAESGLVVTFTDRKAAVLTPEASPALVAPRINDRGYDGVLQRGVIEALCGNAATRPGNYRAALDVWIGVDGHVQRAELLSSTGDSGRDSLVLSALRSFVTPPPPPGTPQPATVLILPKKQDGEEGCLPSRAGMSRP